MRRTLRSWGDGVGDGIETLAVGAGMMSASFSFRFSYTCGIASHEFRLAHGGGGILSLASALVVVVAVGGGGGGGGGGGVLSLGFRLSGGVLSLGVQAQRWCLQHWIQAPCRCRRILQTHLPWI